MVALRPPVSRASITASETAIGAVVVAILVVAETSLLLVDLRHWTLLANALLAVLTLGALGAAALRHRPRLALVPSQLVAVVATAIVAALFAVPGFPVGLAGLDPGVYANHALSIPRTGSFDVPDPVAEHRHELPALQASPNARFPGVNFEGERSGRSVAAFFHLFPALAAPAADLAGERGVVSVNPVLGVLTALVLLLLAWRLFGPIAGWAAGMLSATNVIQVWHARYPSSEMLSELLLVLALLAVALAIDTHWRLPAGIAGACIGMTFLARADGYLLVGLAACLLVALSALGRFDRRAAWFTAGMGVVLVHGFIQAYHLLELYTSTHEVLTEREFAGILLALAAIGLVAHVARRSRGFALVDALADRFRDRRWQVRAGATIVGLAVLVLGFNYLRPLWSGPKPLEPRGTAAVEYYNARSALRLTWFLTPLGVLLAMGGVAFVALRRWRFSAWLAVAPVLLILPLYLWDPRIDFRLIWWTRRFVPVSLPGLILLSACAVAGLVGSRWIGVKALGAVTGIVLVGWWAAMSWPLRHHDELRGSFLVHQAVADVTDDEPAAWLWSTVRAPGGDASANAFASTMLLRRGDPVAMVDKGRAAAGVDGFRKVFADRQLYVIADGDSPPPEIADRVVAVKSVKVVLPYWEITYDRRPKGAGVLPYRFTIWKVR